MTATELHPPRPPRAKPTVIGVDPGGRYVGVAVRAFSGDVVSARVLDRHRLPLCEDRPTWARTVVVYVDDLRAELAAAHVPVIIAAEDVHPPRGHARGRPGHLIDPSGLIDTAVVLGALVLAFTDLVVIAPASPGLAAGYPAAIGKGARLGGPSEHARSAYDVAGAALFRSRFGG